MNTIVDCYKGTLPLSECMGFNKTKYSFGVSYVGLLASFWYRSRKVLVSLKVSVGGYVLSPAAGLLPGSRQKIVCPSQEIVWHRTPPRG